MKYIYGTLIVVLAFAVVGCCSCRKGRKVVDKSLVGTEWRLVEWNGTQFNANDNYTLLLDNESDRFGGKGDCNSIMGNYLLNGKGGLTLESVASTRAMCPDQKREDRFLNDLRRIDAYTLDGDMMLLLSHGEMLMVFKAQPPKQK